MHSATSREIGEPARVDVALTSEASRSSLGFHVVHSCSACGWWVGLKMTRFSKIDYAIEVSKRSLT